MGLTVTLREYKFKSALAALAGGSESGSTSAGAVSRRADERTLPGTYTVKKGDTLWDLAHRFYGDGTKWGVLAEKNGVKDPRTLQIGRVLTL